MCTWITLIINVTELKRDAVDTDSIDSIDSFYFWWNEKIQFSAHKEIYIPCARIALILGPKQKQTSHRINCVESSIFIRQSNADSLSIRRLPFTHGAVCWCSFIIIIMLWIRMVAHHRSTHAICIRFYAVCSR